MIFKLAEAAKKVGSPQWPQPVVENHSRIKFTEESKLSDRKLKSPPPDPFRHQDSASGIRRLRWFSSASSHLHSTKHDIPTRTFSEGRRQWAV